MNGKKRTTPYLFYMVGYPGAGKTSFAAAFAHASGARHLRADAIGFELYSPPSFTLAERQVVLKEMDKRAQEQLGNGVSVVYDAASNQQIARNRIRAFAHKHGAIPIAVWVQTPPQLAEERMHHERQIGTHRYYPRFTPVVYAKMLRAFEQPTASVERVIVISGTDSFERQYSDARSQLHAFWRGWRNGMG